MTCKSDKPVFTKEYIKHIKQMCELRHFPISWKILVKFEFEESNTFQKSVNERNSWKNILQLIRLTGNRSVTWFDIYF